MFAITFILIIFFCKMEIFNFLSTKQYELKDIKKKYNKNNKLKKIDEKYFPVKCHNGIFLGKENEDIISYKGIPFARPPIKNLRWKPPLDCEDSDNIFEAYHFQKSPIQSETPGEDASYYEISEDCLYLNIWKYNDEQKNKPVMVFIHGGDFGWGGTVDPLYDGHNFVKNHNDIILVTITYRLSILGFLDLTLIKGGEDYKESPNLGLLDQIQALKWINKNIENFGGDKNNVTIFGESAGGSSVTLLPLINGTKGLFKRIISQSGSFAWTINKEAGKKVIDNLKAIIKKEGKEEFDINYLLNLSEEEIIKLNIQFDSYRKSPMRDGFILPEDCYEAVKNGAYNGKGIEYSDCIENLILHEGNFINNYFIEPNNNLGFKKIIKAILYSKGLPGKTCLLKRLTQNYFLENFGATIGVDFDILKFEYKCNEYKIQIWDTNGSERFRAITSSYLKNIDIILIIIDLTDLEGIDKSFIEEIKSKIPKNALKYLVLNKIDLLEEGKNNYIDNLFEWRKKAKLLIENKEIDYYFEVSAKNKKGIDNLLKNIKWYILRKADCHKEKFSKSKFCIDKYLSL